MHSNNFKMDRLLLAMAEHEGWYSVGSSQSPSGSRAYRNHNPGNLRNSPFADRLADGYAIFGSDAMGWFAFWWDIAQKAKGNTSTGLGPASTLRDLIFKWAPPSDNNKTELYLQDVIKKSGLPETLTLKELIV